MLKTYLNSLKLNSPFFIIIILLAFSATTKGQNSVAIGSPTVKENAVLWLNGNGNQGLLLPVVANLSNIPISGPDDRGMIVYLTSDEKIYYRNASAWVEIGAGGSAGTTYGLAYDPSTGEVSLVNGGTDLTVLPSLDGDVTGNLNNTEIAIGVVGTTEISNGSIALEDLSPMGLGSTDTGRILQWNGTAWETVVNTGGTSLTAGTGIDITAGVISNTGDTDASDDLTNSSSISDLANVNVTSPSTGQVMKYDGTNWVNDTDNSGGTPTVDNVTIELNGASELRVKDGGITTSKIADNSINGSKLDVNAVDIQHINPDAVDGSKIADGAVGTSELGNDAVTGDKIALGAVGSTEVLDGSITDVDINAGAAIAVSKLAAGTNGQVLTTVGTTPTWQPAGTAALPNTGNREILIGDGGSVNAVTTTGDVEIASDGTTTITNVAATGNSIVNAINTGAGTINAGRLTLPTNHVINTDAPNAAGDISGNFNTGLTIDTDAVDGAKIADAAVGSTELADDAITLAKIADGGANGQVIRYDGTDWVLDLGANKWTSGAAAANNGDGELDGSYYLDTSTGEVYYKTGGVYGSVGNIQGADGIDGDKYATTSGTSINPSPAIVGSTFTITVDDTGLAYTAGQTIVAASLADPASDNFEATVLSYDGSTSLSVLGTVGNGTGFHTDWEVNLTGAPGAAGQDAYTYIGYADDAVGTGFNTAAGTREYIGFVTSTTALTPIVGDFVSFTQFRDLILTDGNIVVGSGANARSEVAMSGDAAIINTGAVTVTGIQGQPVAVTAPTANQILQYNAGQWEPTTLATGATDLQGAYDGAAAASITMATSRNIDIETFGGVPVLTLQESNGFIGIGTTSPNSSLDIVGNNAGGVVSSITNANSAGRASLDLVNDGGELYSLSVGGSTSGTAPDKFYIFNNGAARLTLTPLGEVGIGTTTPAASLDVVSTGTAVAGTTNSSAAGNYAVSGVNSGTGDVAGFFHATNVAGGGNSHGVYAQADGQGAGVFGATGGTLGIAGRFQTQNAANANPTVQIWNLGSGVNLYSDGPIQIEDGSQGPGKVLTSDNDGVASWQNAGGSPWTVNGSDINYLTGNVGIGVAVPTETLDIRGATAADATSMQLSNSDESHRLIMFSGNSGDPNPFIGVEGSDPLRFVNFDAGFTELARFDEQGRFGIGTPLPLSRFQVAVGDMQLDEGYSLLAIDPTAVFSYLSTTDVPHYGVGWYSDSETPGLAQGYLSGFAGIKMFTNGIRRMSVSLNGNVSIGTLNPAINALLDLQSTTQGLLMPRLTTTERNAISGPETGLMIFNSTTNGFNYYDGGSWLGFGGAAATLQTAYDGGENITLLDGVTPIGITATSGTSDFERLMTFDVSDATGGSLYISNTTNTDTEFSPTFFTTTRGNNSWGFRMNSLDATSRYFDFDASDNNGLIGDFDVLLAMFNNGATRFNFTGAGELGIAPTLETAISLRAYGTGVGNTSQLEFRELGANGNNVVGFKSPDALANDVILTLPATIGADGEVLTTDALGNLSWTSTTGLTASNGLNIVGSDLQLGGVLTVNTAIDNAGFDLGITGQGNVGIGIANPNSSLHIVSNNDNTALHLSNNYNATSGDKYGINSGITGTGSGRAYGIYSYVAPASSGDSYGFYSSVENDGGTGNQYLFFGQNESSGPNLNYGIYADGVTENYLDGSLGIGIVTPSSPLHIVSSVGAVARSGSVFMDINSANTDSRSYIRFTQEGATMGDPTYFGTDFENGFTEIWSENSFYDFRVGTGNVERMNIDGTSGAVTLSNLSSGIVKSSAAGLLSSGALSTTDIPNLAASKITSGTFSTTRIPNLSATKITSGTLPVSRGGTGSTSFTSGSVILSNGSTLTQDNSGLFFDITNNELGIGTTAPSELLQVSGTVTATDGTDGTGILISNSTATTGATTGITFVTNGSSSSLGKTGVIHEDAGSNGIGKLHLAATTTSTISYKVGVTDSKLTVLNTGEVGVGTTNPDVQFEVFDGTGSNALRITGTGAAFSSPALELNANGTGGDWRVKQIFGLLNFSVGDLEAGSMTDQFAMGDGGISSAFLSYNNFDLGNSSTRWGTLYATNGTINTSDRRLKKNIFDLQYGLNEILKLNPVSYQWKNDDFGTKVHLGFIAQEVLDLVPEVVNIGDDENQSLGLRYTEIVPVAIKAIQEQQEIIKSQDDKITELEKRIAALEVENISLKKTDLNDGQLKAMKAEIMKEVKAMLGAEANNK